MENKRVLINFLAKDGTREKLQYLAQKTERSQSGYLRWLIDREYESMVEGNQEIEKIGEAA